MAFGVPAVLLFLAAPKTPAVMLAFAAVMGVSFLSTMSLTSSIRRTNVSRAFLCVFIRLSSWVGWKASRTSSLPNSVRVNSNNLLELHI